jgi:hypothetical protein
VGGGGAEPEEGSDGRRRDRAWAETDLLDGHDGMQLAALLGGDLELDTPAFSGTWRAKEVEEDGDESSHASEAMSSYYSVVSPLSDAGKMRLPLQRPRLPSPSFAPRLPPSSTMPRHPPPSTLPRHPPPPPPLLSASGCDAPVF